MYLTVKIDAAKHSVKGRFSGEGVGGRLFRRQGSGSSQKHRSADHFDCVPSQLYFLQRAESFFGLATPEARPGQPARVDGCGRLATDESYFRAGADSVAIHFPPAHFLV
jgi:hypothetical protein